MNDGSRNNEYTYTDYCNFLKSQPYCNFGQDDQDNFMCVTYSSKFFEIVLKENFRKFILAKLIKYCNDEFKIDSFNLIYENMSVSKCLNDAEKTMIYICHHHLEKHSREPYSVTMGIIEDYLKNFNQGGR